MEKMDAKRLSPEKQYELRQQIVLMRKKGMTNQHTADHLGLSVSHCSRIWKAYQQTGMEGISLKIRGRRVGAKRLLSMDQEKEIQSVVLSTNPEEVQLLFALWNREAIGQLIRQRYGMYMPPKTIDNYLRRWGYKMHQHSYFVQNWGSARIRGWKEQTYLQIRKMAKHEGGEIFWKSEKGIHPKTYHAGDAIIRRRRSPIHISMNSMDVNMIAAVTNRGKARFKFYEERTNESFMIDFMHRLVKDANRKVFLIDESLSVCTGQQCQEWLRTHRDEIEVHFLPEPFASVKR